MIRIRRHLEYPKKLRKLHIVYYLAPDKIGIKREILSKYQLLIADIYEVSIGNIKKLLPNFLIKKVFFIIKTYSII